MEREPIIQQLLDIAEWSPSPKTAWQAERLAEAIAVASDDLVEERLLPQAERMGVIA